MAGSFLYIFSSGGDVKARNPTGCDTRTNIVGEETYEL